MTDFINFKLAQKLKDKGFREECLLHYTDTGSLFSNSIDTYDRPNQELDYSDFQKCFNNGNSIGLVDVPTISQVLKWLREEKRICVEINCNYTDYFPTVRKLDYHETDYVSGCDIYKTYEEAALAGIEYVLDNLI